MVELFTWYSTTFHTNQQPLMVEQSYNSMVIKAKQHQWYRCSLGTVPQFIPTNNHEQVFTFDIFWNLFYFAFFKLSAGYGF